MTYLRTLILIVADSPYSL